MPRKSDNPRKPGPFASFQNNFRVEKPPYEPGKELRSGQSITMKKGESEYVLESFGC
jgi:hypothetical protein